MVDRHEATWVTYDNFAEVQCVTKGQYGVIGRCFQDDSSAKKKINGPGLWFHSLAQSRDKACTTTIRSVGASLRKKKKKTPDTALHSAIDR